MWSVLMRVPIWYEVAVTLALLTITTDRESTPERYLTRPRPGPSIYTLGRAIYFHGPNS